MANQMGMLSGMPMNNNSYQTNASAAPGAAQQLFATGIGIAGLDQAFGGKGGGGLFSGIFGP